MKKIWKKNKRTILAGLGIVLLAVLLRFCKLSSLPIFADEAIYVRWAQVMRENSAFRFLPLSDVFMWTMIPFLKIISNPLMAGRILSGLCGIGTLVGIFVLTLDLFKSKKVALIAAAIYAISPFSVFFDRMALAGAMLTMFGVWTLVFAAITAKKLRLDTAMLAGFALGGALLTKSPAIFFVLLLPMTILLVKWPKGNKKRGIYLGKLIFLWGVTLVIGFGLMV
ncbi:MAG: glycosyltransferase family 39 protein [Patescibacteria group bacterium]